MAVEGFEPPIFTYNDGGEHDVRLMEADQLATMQFLGHAALESAAEDSPAQTFAKRHVESLTEAIDELAMNDPETMDNIVWACLEPQKGKEYRLAGIWFLERAHLAIPFRDLPPSPGGTYERAVWEIFLRHIDGDIQAAAFESLTRVVESLGQFAQKRGDLRGVHQALDELKQRIERSRDSS